MRQFKMKGMAITGYTRFREFFAPGELLRQRELAAGFLYQEFRRLTDISMYHTEMFYLAAFPEPEDEEFLDFVSFQSYHQVGEVLANLDRYAGLRKALLRQHFMEPEQQNLLKEMWALSRAATALTPVQRDRLFCLLMAGYSLAGKDPEHCPLSVKEAEKAFLRLPEEQQEDRWFALTGAGEIRLEAREKPYRILMAQEAENILRAGGRIVQRKITALPHAQSSAGIPVTLLLYDGAEDPVPQEVTIQAGDYRYANFVGGSPVKIHPAVCESGACRMERFEKKIFFTDKHTGQHRELFNPKIEPIAFAVEENAPGWVLLYDGGLDDYFYTRKKTYPIHRKDVVEVAFRGEECLVLDSAGTVYSGFGKIYRLGLPSLDGFQG